MKPKVIVTEFKALYKTSCPYVITLYDSFYREGSILMILEYMNCGSLEDILKTCGKIPEGVLSKMTKQVGVFRCTYIGIDVVGIKIFT
jgi:serine/threonine protein kinase